MQTESFTLPPISQTTLSISHVDLEGSSPLNQSEPHIHEACEVYVNLSGDVAFEVENRLYPISRGSVIITRPYEYHHCIALSQQRHEHLWITFSADDQDDFLKLFFGRKKGRDNLILLEDAQLQTLLTITQHLLTQNADALAQRIAFLQLMQLLQDGKADIPQGIPAHLGADVTAALRFMDAHLTEDLAIGTLAAACNVSPNTLERHFQEAFHMTPFAVLRRRRLFRSMELLRNGYSVAEAARESGFSDYSHYIQLFKKQFGITPLHYKKKFRPSQPKM